MTSVSAAGKDSLVMNLKQNLNVSKENADKDSFSKIMEKNQRNDYSQKPQNDKYDYAVKNKTQIENLDKKVLQEEKVVQSKLEKSSLDKQPIEALDEASQKVVKAVAEELGITVEEVMQALETLNLTPMDLLQMNNMGNLLVELSGDGDMLNLLTDENMFQSLKQLNELVKTTVQELKQTFSLTDEEFTQLLDQKREELLQGKNLLLSKDSITNSEKQQIPVDVSMQKTEPEEDMKLTDLLNKAVKGSETKSEQGIDSKTGVNTLTAKETEAASSTAEVNKSKVEVQVDQSASGKQNPFNQASKQDGMQEESKEDGSKNQGEQGLYQNTAGKLNAAQLTKNEAPILNQSPDTENIMKQIMDYMKIQVKADATQMEIQLHPANLGTINVQISSKEGVITAQFTAQNEGVKAALESQIVQLKENFNEQGLKVEAVEVTVASHQFERNMNQGSKDASNSQETKKKGIRRINLDQMEELEEAGMEEADLITADMMIKNGNTVDYTA